MQYLGVGEFLANQQDNRLPWDSAKASLGIKTVSIADLSRKNHAASNKICKTCGVYR